MSKISGIHANNYPGGFVAYVETYRPGWVKTLDMNRATTEDAMARSPETRWIGRMWKDIHDQANYVDRQEEGAEQFFLELQSQALWPIVDTWEGINEPGAHPTPEYYRFEVRLADLMRDAGKQYACHACSVGTWAGSPSDPMYDWKSTWVHEVLRRSSFLNIHEYSAPHMRSEFKHFPDIAEEDGGFYTLRYRRAYKVVPEAFRIPILITECGIDSLISPPWRIPGRVAGTHHGWRKFTTPEDYVSQLQWYLTRLREDGFVAGMTPFCLYARDPTWNDTFGMWDSPVKELWGEVMLHEEQPIPPETDWQQRALVAEDKLERIERIVEE